MVRQAKLKFKTTTRKRYDDIKRRDKIHITGEVRRDLRKIDIPLGETTLSKLIMSPSEKGSTL